MKFKIIIVVSLLVSNICFSYVSVKPHYSIKRGYVKPHIRSNPNHIKGDNLRYKPKAMKRLK
jgi:hypothetical protein